MRLVADLLVGALAGLHLWFLVLEMFLWRRPLGLRTFGMSAADAEVTAPLAANQGLYNGFLAAGLAWSLIARDPTGLQFKVFFLGCVIVAGVFGGFTASRRILVVQALPGVLALAAVLAGR